MRNQKRDQTQKAKRQQTSSATTGSDELAAVIVPVDSATGDSDPLADPPSAGNGRRSICSLNSLRTSSSSSQCSASSLRIRALILAFSAFRRSSSASTSAVSGGGRSGCHNNMTEFPMRSAGSPLLQWLSGGVTQHIRIQKQSGYLLTCRSGAQEYSAPQSEEGGC